MGEGGGRGSIRGGDKGVLEGVKVRAAVSSINAPRSIRIVQLEGGCSVRGVLESGLGGG